MSNDDRNCVIVSKMEMKAIAFDRMVNHVLVNSADSLKAEEMATMVLTANDLIEDIGETGREEEVSINADDNEGLCMADNDYFDDLADEDIEPFTSVTSEE